MTNVVPPTLDPGLSTICNVQPELQFVKTDVVSEECAMGALNVVPGGLHMQIGKGLDSLTDVLIGLRPIIIAANNV